MSQKCAFNAPIPAPPTTIAACAVPIGGSNATSLDVCCNSHVNPVSTYSGNDADEDCYQYCTTDSPNDVKSCLNDQLGALNNGEPSYQCFNLDDVQQKNNGDGYGSGASSAGRPGWLLTMMCGLGFVGMAVGAI